MKTYVVICETMSRAKWLWGYTRHCLGHVVHYINKAPMLNIETYDGVLLYFTSYDMWYGRQELCRHDWETIHDLRFQKMVTIWASNNNPLRRKQNEY